MTSEEHKERHVILHQMLDELVADFIRHTEKRPSKTSLFEFMQWSNQQTINPTEYSWYCPLCGQQNIDGKPCGCGARR